MTAVQPASNAIQHKGTDRTGSHVDGGVHPQTPRERHFEISLKSACLRAEDR